jgi:methyl-accepting chemotaxis protein
MKMRLAHKIVLGFGVLVLLSGVFAPAVFYSYFKQLSGLLVEPPDQVLELVGNGETMAVAIGVLSVILGAVIAFFLIKQIVTPVRAINIALAEHLERGKSVRVHIPNKDELGVLAIYLNELMEKKG